MEYFQVLKLLSRLYFCIGRQIYEEANSFVVASLVLAEIVESVVDLQILPTVNSNPQQLNLFVKYF